jgi:hypothetical protein
MAEAVYHPPDPRNPNPAGPDPNTPVNAEIPVEPIDEEE